MGDKIKIETGVRPFEDESGFRWTIEVEGFLGGDTTIWVDQDLFFSLDDWPEIRAGIERAIDAFYAATPPTDTPIEGE